MNFKSFFLTKNYNLYELSFMQNSLLRKYSKHLHIRSNKFLSVNYFFFRWLIGNLFYFEHYFFFVEFLFFIKKRFFFNDLVLNSLLIKDVNVNFLEFFKLNFLKTKYSMIPKNFDFYSKFSIYGVFRLNENLFLYKNFLINFSEMNKNAKMLKKSFSNFFFKYNSLQINFYFIKYRIFGLGFKIKKVSFLNKRVLSLEIGLGHKIFYLLSERIKCFRRKRHFFLFSSSEILLKNISYHFSRFKKLNPYKIRGIKDVKLNIRMKKGKKQGQKK